ncbi:MAG TPA: BPSS1780 family membrane protein [Usitatibacter sp.]|nr:BPSS1780 family membrane protein [Usitatibacter sp.]
MDTTMKVTEIPASRGAAWLSQGFGLFRRKPMVWIGLCAGWLLITFGLYVVPLVGGVLANFLQPVFFASFAIAALRQEAGEPVAMGDLFQGFRRNMRALVNLGAILLLAEIAIFAFMALLGLPLDSGVEKGGFTMGDYMETFKGKEWILFIGLLLMALVKGALWFAPPLIALHGMTTGHAMRWSVYAALANVGSMALYGILLFLLFFVAVVTWGIGFLVVIPMMVISTYVGYREVFEARPAAASS